MIRMTKKARTILFLLCFFLFLLIAPLAVLYSQGYRFDFENKALSQTGGIFIKAEPRQAEIYLNDQLVKRTDFFFGSALIENLLPKKYKIEVKKPGYLSWEKNLEVREKEVTEAKEIFLFPENLNFTILTKGAESFWFSPDGKKVILFEEDKPSSLSSLSKESSELEKDKEGWALKLYDLEKNIKSHLINEVDIYSKGANLLNLEFSEDSREIYLKIGKKEQEKSFVLRLDRAPPLLTEKDSTSSPPDIDSSPENIIASCEVNNDLYYLDNSGNLFENKQKLTEKVFPVQAETEYILEVFQKFIFLGEGQLLYLFSPDSKSFEKFFEETTDLKISPDDKKLVFFSSSEIWVLFLTDEGNKKAGKKLFLVRLSEKIDDVFWLNSDYLIFNSGDSLKIIEIDERDKVQTWDFATPSNFGAEAEIYFNGNDKKIYILSERSLFVSKKLF